MKKLLSLLLALMMLFTAVAAIAEEVQINEEGEVENPEAIVAGENELIFWSLFSGGEGGYMEKLVEEYNATNPKMTVRNVMLDWGEYYTKLMTGVSVGKGPDIGISHIAKLPELYDQGVVVAMDKYAQEAGFDWTQVNQNTLAAATIDGEIYAVPLDTHPDGLLLQQGPADPGGRTQGGRGPGAAAERRRVLHLMKTSRPRCPRAPTRWPSRPRATTRSPVLGAV